MRFAKGTVRRILNFNSMQFFIRVVDIVIDFELKSAGFAVNGCKKRQLINIFKFSLVYIVFSLKF